MRLKRRSQKYLAVLSACCVVYFWGTWTLHSLLDDAGTREQVKGKGQWSDAPAISGKDKGKVVISGKRKDRSIKRKSKRSSKLLTPDGSAQTVLPPALPSDGKFSACLIVMDDNHLLTEWLVSSASCVLDTYLFRYPMFLLHRFSAYRSILTFSFSLLQAYHYHTLPLRHLIVSVDPRSKTSPTPILDRWREHGMDIVQWKDDDFMPPDDRKEAEFHVKRYFGNITPDLIQHRARQRLFYFSCMKRLKEQNRDWTLLIDSDEYLYVNYPTVAALNLTAPPINQTGSVMSFLKEELQRPGNNLTSPCVQMPRIRFGSQESEVAKLKRHVPVGFNASFFQTLRWRKHASSDNYFANRISKTMIDLSRVVWSELVPVDSIHMPIRSICGQRKLHIRKEEQVFVINHYLGTWEQYSYRDDSRTGKERSHKVS